MAQGRFSSTAQIAVPAGPLERIIGQDGAVAMARIAAQQRRHLILVGPPGTGKSLIARAMASVLPAPKQEISVMDNPERPERPLVEVRGDAAASRDEGVRAGKEVPARDVPLTIAERLGLRCRRCGVLLPGPVVACGVCGAYVRREDGRIASTARLPSGEPVTIFYSIGPQGRPLALTEAEVRKEEESLRRSRRKVLLPLKRNPFVQAGGASEAELLGDVAHDPYGGRGELGTPAFMRVLPGAVHEAHEGVLFIDELASLGALQRHLLTAMQDRSYPISGKNATSSGAAVRVDSVPCDFILVGAANANDLSGLLPALRSRISGDGYEVLMNSAMPDNDANRAKLALFVAQEIARDGRIPHASYGAVEELATHARKIAKEVDNEPDSLTLRLRSLGGVVKLAGDLAAVEKAELIGPQNIRDAIQNARSIEEKMQEKYGSAWRAAASDYPNANKKSGPEIA